MHESKIDKQIKGSRFDVLCEQRKQRQPSEKLANRKGPRRQKIKQGLVYSSSTSTGYRYVRNVWHVSRFWKISVFCVLKLSLQEGFEVLDVSEQISLTTRRLSDRKVPPSQKHRRSECFLSRIFPISIFSNDSQTENVKGECPGCLRAVQHAEGFDVWVHKRVKICVWFRIIGCVNKQKLGLLFGNMGDWSWHSSRHYLGTCWWTVNAIRSTHIFWSIFH